LTFCGCENYLHQLRKLHNLKALLVTQQNANVCAISVQGKLT